MENSSDLCGFRERCKEVKETPTFVVTSTTRTLELVCGVAKPWDKSLCPTCLLLLTLVLSFLFLFVSSSPKLFLGFGLNLRCGDLSASKEQSQCFTLPLGSGVVSYWIHKVHFSTCSTFPVGVRTSNSLRRNFWRRREFRPKLSGLLTVADKWLWVLYRIF